MKNKLLLFGIIISVYTYFLLSAFFYLYGDSTIVAVERKVTYSEPVLKAILFGAIVIIPAHVLYCRNVYKKNKMELAFIIPYFAVPYMLGIIVHTMIQ